VSKIKDENTKNALVGMATQALATFKPQAEGNNYDHRAKLMLGLYYLNLRNFDLAVKTLEDAVTLAPNKQVALTYLAKAYLLKGDIKNASINYEKAIAVTPANINGYNGIRIEYIQALMLAGDDKKALNYIKELLPTATRLEFNSLVGQMMQVYTARKDIKGIVKLLSDASNLDPLNQNFALWLAQAYVAGGDYNGAIFAINKLSSSNPQVVAQFTEELNNYLKTQKK
jgi:tetratricopeptide (TPR) repeat protein